VEVARWSDGKPVRVGGSVVCQQAPGIAKGLILLTLEDERGLVNVIVLLDVYARYSLDPARSVADCDRRSGPAQEWDRQRPR
jgi:hypothetical protein